MRKLESAILYSESQTLKETTLLSLHPSMSSSNLRPHAVSLEKEDTETMKQLQVLFKSRESSRGDHTGTQTPVEQRRKIYVP